MKIYLAGPLFTAAERSFNCRLRDLLVNAGHEVWLPQECEPRETSSSAIFAEDVKGIEWSEVVVANMDGPDPDSGTCWECGYAYQKKPVVVFRTDFRAGDDPKMGPYNLMLTKSATASLNMPFQTVEKVAECVISTLAEVHEKQSWQDATGYAKPLVRR
jgi:nucleoside 2-deoxyribosyltransferase